MPLYNAHGFRGVYLGDEAIIRCDTFTLDGGALKQVRSAVKRVGKGPPLPAHPRVRCLPGARRRS